MVLRTKLVAAAMTVAVAVLMLAGASAVWAAPILALRPAAKSVYTAPNAIKSATVHAQGVNSAAPDIYEPDNVPAADARDVTSLIPRWDASTPGWGKDPYTEVHTISTATTTTADEDWFKFTVSGTDYNAWSQLSYMIDAYSPDPGVDTVVDVYHFGQSFVSANATSGADHLADASNDDAPWTSWMTAGRWSSVSFLPHVKPGHADTFWVRVRPYFYGSAGFSGRAGTYTLRIKTGQVTRLAAAPGGGRVETAIRLAQETFPTYPTASHEASVVIAYGWGYADALAGSSLAGASGGPILLTPADHIPVALANEIRRLGVKGAYVIGGPTVVKDTVMTDLAAILGASRVRRVSGSDRVGTSIAVMNETKKVLTQKGQIMPHTAFVVYGWNYPDALAVSPVSFYNHAPVLLTHKDHLDAALVPAMGSYFTDVVIAGSTSVVSDAVVTNLQDSVGILPADVYRASGRDRYETAKEVAAWACDLKGPGPHNNGRMGTSGNATALFSLPNANLNAYASGQNYPDALAGGPFAGNAGAPLLLTYKDSTPVYLFGADGEMPAGATSWFSDLANNGRDPILRSYVIGGDSVVSGATFGDIDNMTGLVSP
jgi:putative cell wall-binding protein